MARVFSASSFAGSRTAVPLALLFVGTLTPARSQTIGTANLGANQVTLQLTSPANGTGSFTLLTGSATCGTAAQTVAGTDSTGTAAARRGSVVLQANTAASYTIRNLLGSTTYTVCFTPDGSAAPISATVTTNAATDLSFASWTLVGTAGFSAGATQSEFLAFSPDGTPYVAYSDASYGYGATVMRFNGTSWVTVGSPGFSAGEAYYVYLAFSVDGTPYIAYADGGSGYHATVMRFNGTSWVTVGSAGFTAGDAYWKTLAFSPDGTPYLAFSDGANNYYSTVMRFDGSAWVLVGSAAFSAGSAFDESLAFSPDGTPYVAYHDGGNNYYATVMRFDGTSWTPVGGAGFSGVDAAYDALAFSPGGTPYLAYQDRTNGNKATVVQFNGSSWVPVGTADLSPGGTYDESLAFSPDSTPYVAYQDASNGGKATVMRFNGTSWVPVGSPGFSAGGTGWEHLAFSPDGLPYVVFADAATNSGATVMRFAFVPPAATTSAATAIDASSATLNGLVNDNGSATAVAFDYGATASYGTTLAATTPAGGTVAAGSGNTSVSVGVTGLQPVTTYHFRVDATAFGMTIYGSDTTFTTDKATPAVTYPTASGITYGQTLSASVLTGGAATYNGATVAGSFAWTTPSVAPAAGSYPSTYTVTFTPSDTTTYYSVTNGVSVTVSQATPTITWAAPAPIPYGTALSGTQLDASASGSGSFSYSPSVGTVLSIGSHTLSTTFTPTDTTDYSTQTATVTVNVVQATPTVTWSAPASIPYGTALSGTQLDASSSVPGSFSYSPAAGTVLPAGSHTLTTTFTPTDTTDYTTQTATVTVNVVQATPTVTWSAPASIPYGTALSGTQLDASSSVPGSFSYSPAAGTVLPAGSHTLTTTFTPSDTTDYSTQTAMVTVNVAQATPTVTWSAPTSIPYGTALSGTQLSATASVPGSFSYSPAAGTVLPAGSHTLTTTFTPSDTTDYTTQAATVTINVLQATPTVTWSAPASIPYGTALSGTQLDASASVPGSFSYSPAAGTVLPAGSHTLSTTFTPSDTTDYNTQTATVTVNVVQATPTVTWSAPASIPYGTALSGTQLDAAASVPGSFSYSPAAGTVLPAGSHTLTTTFTPSDTTDYSTQMATVTVNVAQATPTVTWSAPASIPYGTALSGTQLNATASVPGTFVYSPGAGTVLQAGSHTLTTTFTPTDTTDYTTQTATVTVNVVQTTPTITVSGKTLIYATTSTTLTANISYPSGPPSVAPVAFVLNGSTYVGTCAASAASRACTAEVPTRTLPIGTTTVAVTEAADSAYPAATGTGELTITPAPDFSFAVAGPTTQTAVPGASASFELALSSPYPSYPGPFSFAVTGLPGNATYTITPATIDVTGGPQTATLTITFAKPAAPTAVQSSRSTPRGQAPVRALAVILLPGIFLRRRPWRRVPSPLVLGPMLMAGSLAALAAFEGCGVYTIQAPAADYVINVAAQSGTVQHAVTVTLDVP